MSIIKKTLFGAFVLLAGVIAASFVFIGDPPQSQPAYATSNDNVQGWAWSGNVGWISFNCTTDSSCGSSNYGVNVDEATGELSGEAWNDKVGWISFNRSETGNPPAQPYKTGNSYIARYSESTQEVAGWAKILSMGDNGWIKLRKFSSDSGPSYGVSITNAGVFSGWAWNGNADGSGIGWISFNCATDGSCGSSNYKVMLDPKPEVTGIATTQFDYCLPLYQDARTTKLSWTFFEATGQSQTGYQIEIATNNGFGKNSIATSSSDWVESSAEQVIVNGQDNLAYNTTYYWHVRVRDESNQASDNWSSTGTFTTPKNNYPNVDFSYSPSSPRALEDVAFTSNVSVDTTNTPGNTATYLWEFQQAGETSTTTPNPTEQFYDTSGASAQLTITDSSGYSCSKLNDAIGVTSSLPIWRETKVE